MTTPDNEASKAEPKRAEVGPPASPRCQMIAILWSLVLMGGTLALYWPVSGYPFINYDDPVYVTENPHVQRGLRWAGVKWAFTNLDAAFWHPLTWLSHSLDWQLYGNNAGGHHLTNLLFHAANTLLLFLVLRRMTNHPSPVQSLQSKVPPPAARFQTPDPKLPTSDFRLPTSDLNLWPCAFVAALFAWHPLHVESVAWVSERKDVLSGFFFLLTLWAYARYAGKPEARSQKSDIGPPPADLRPLTSGYYWLALFFFACGLMSKPMVVTLPFVLLLLDYWPLRRVTFEAGGRTLDFGLIREKLPFFALTLAACVLAYLAQHRAGAVRTFDEIPLSLRLANAVTSYAVYLRRLFWPTDLAVIYPFPTSVPALAVLLAVLLLAVVSVAAALTVRRRPYVAVGWCWYLGMLVPVIGLVPIGDHAVADRFTYLPLIGPFILITWGVHDALGQRGRSGRVLLTAATILAIGGCLFVSARQVRYWENSRALFTRAVRVTANNYVAHANLGITLGQAGDLDGARAHLAEALRLKPGTAQFHYNLALAYAQQSRWPEAEFHLRAALRSEPGHPMTHYHLGCVLVKQRRFAEAIPSLLRALQIKPDFAEPHRDLAWILATHPEPEYRNGAEAVRLAERASQLAPPDDVETLDTLAAAYAEAGRFGEAVQTARRALALARATGQGERAAQLETRLDLYQSGQPCRQPAASRHREGEDF